MSPDTSFIGFLGRFRNACEMIEHYTDFGPLSDVKKVERLYNALPLIYRQHLGNKFGCKRVSPLDDRFTVDCDFEKLCQECEIISINRTAEKRQLQDAQKLVAKQPGNYDNKKRWSDKFIKREKFETEGDEKKREGQDQKPARAAFKCVFHATNDHSGHTCFAEKRRIRDLGLRKALNLIAIHNPSSAELLNGHETKEEHTDTDSTGSHEEFDDLDGGVSSGSEHAKVDAVIVNKSDKGFRHGGLF
jgi:hypothetical protein